MPPPRGSGGRAILPPAEQYAHGALDPPRSKRVLAHDLSALETLSSHVLGSAGRMRGQRTSVDAAVAHVEQAAVCFKELFLLVAGYNARLADIGARLWRSIASALEQALSQARRELDQERTRHAETRARLQAAETHARDMRDREVETFARLGELERETATARLEADRAIKRLWTEQAEVRRLRGLIASHVNVSPEDNNDLGVLEAALPAPGSRAAAPERVGALPTLARAASTTDARGSASPRPLGEEALDAIRRAVDNFDLACDEATTAARETDAKMSSLVTLVRTAGRAAPPSPPAEAEGPA